MFRLHQNIKTVLEEFQLDYKLRYSRFVPRLYNLCKSFGFEPGDILPSRAFCSDENQGYPIILLAKHFGAFPFNHGQVGGVVAIDRHGPFADHGKDLVIVQASHVGYEPDSESFGIYRRLQTEGDKCTTTCGKIGVAIDWYQKVYDECTSKIMLSREGEDFLVTIDQMLLQNFREEGLFLYSEAMVECDEGYPKAFAASHPNTFKALDTFVEQVGAQAWPESGEVAIGKNLGPNHFFFRKQINESHHLERNLNSSMPWIVTAEYPMLAAAQVTSHIEFDRTVRSIVKCKDFENRRLFFISCINLDVSPDQDVVFPKTYCVPWAAYHQNGSGGYTTYNQKEIIALLRDQPNENPDQVNLETAAPEM